jgi:hypothetical protein
VDAVGEVVAGGVGGADGEGGGGDVGSSDVSVGEMVGESDGDGPGAGADVEDMEGLGLGRRLGRRQKQVPPLRCGMTTKFHEDSFDEELGFGAGDEDGGGDVEGQAVELLLAGDVLDGLVGEAAGDEGLVGGGLVGGERAVGVGVVGGAGEGGDVEE